MRAAKKKTNFQTETDEFAYFSGWRRVEWILQQSVEFSNEDRAVFVQRVPLNALTPNRMNKTRAEGEKLKNLRKNAKMQFKNSSISPLYSLRFSPTNVLIFPRNQIVLIEKTCWYRAECLLQSLLARDHEPKGIFQLQLRLCDSTIERRTRRTVRK